MNKLTKTINHILRKKMVDDENRNLSIEGNNVNVGAEATLNNRVTSTKNKQY